MNDSVTFFEPWMALIGAIAIAFAYAHKRYRYQAKASWSALRQLMVPLFIYFLPAFFGWFFIVMAGVHFAAERGHPISGIVAQLGVIAGFLVLQTLLLSREIRLVREQPSKW